jgi:redox-sensitive bicupin YhaK (pirin superfamily)
MNLQHIPSSQRYGMKQGWLDTKWHFSFDHYYDPANTHFGALRVFNDDWVDPASGFPTHPHREMEIVTLLLEGTLAHKDTTGGQHVMRAGDVQRMTAGTGIAHSEMNPDPKTRAHLLQVWVIPEAQRLEPGYEQKRFDPAERVGRLVRVVTREPTDGELQIHQDVDFWLGTLRPGDTWTHRSRPGRRQYLFVISGALTVDGKELAAGDQGRITGAEQLVLATRGDANAEVVLIDLP